MMELIIVMVIIGILSGIAYVSFAPGRTVATASGARQDLLRLQQQVTDAYQEAGGYPASTGAWVTSVAAPTSFTSTTGYQLQITTDAGNQGATLQVRNTGATVTCSVNVGTRSSPGVVTCS